MSYNILDGGEGRADPLGEVIEAQRPDIVALVEADHSAVVERIARRLGMDYISAPGNQHAAALLSRWPIVESLNHAPAKPILSDCLLEATVREPGGQEWTVGVVHLHAHGTEADETRREQEIAAVLDVFAPYRRRAREHLLVGDFNANSPIQRIDPAKCKPRTQRDWEANGGHLPRRVVQKVLDAGYVDSLHSVKGEAAATIGTFTTQHPGQRVDYIFACGLLPGRLRDAWVEQDRLAKYASDHFPVGLEVK